MGNEEQGVEPSYSVEPDKFEKTSGLKVSDKILNVRPQGARLIVMLNPPKEEYGAIVIPDTIRATERMGSGWVVAVGPMVGRDGPVMQGGNPICRPWDLLYKQVIFGATTGRIIRVDFLDRETKSPYLVFTDRDIWAIDLNPTENEVGVGDG